MAQTLESGADDIVRTAKILVPVKSGATRASIRKERVAGGDADLTIAVVAGGRTVPQARWIEFGTAPHINKGRFAGTQNPGMAAQPFFYPAYRLKKRAVKARVTRAMKKAIKESI